MIKYVLLEDADDFKTWWGDESWSGANDRYDDFIKLSDKRQDELAGFGYDSLFGCDDEPKEQTTVNDYIWFDEEFNNLLDKLAAEQEEEEKNEKE